MVIQHLLDAKSKLATYAHQRRYIGLAFLLERTMEFKLKKANLSASPQKIQEILNSMNFAEVKIERSKFLIKTKFDSLGSKILRLLHIKPPKNLAPTGELSL